MKTGMNAGINAGMNASLTCQDEKRRQAVRTDDRLNGLDYLEVELIETGGRRQIYLCVHFLGPVPSPDQIRLENIQIEGGQRIREIRAIGLSLHIPDDPTIDGCLRIQVDQLGDFSPYWLRIVNLSPQSRLKLDPRYDRLQFFFRAGCPTDLDCKSQPVCPAEPLDEPEINYLAKDYASFRQIILDRLALLLPDWQERHVPDLGITLVELLAYVGDYLSYYQDAVATEAYLDTARQRRSVRRHVRLIDYPMHEGCNARTWVWLETSQDTSLNLQQAFFITAYPNAPTSGTVLQTDDLTRIPADRYAVFEPLAPTTLAEMPLYQAHNKICFYTWGDRQCCLPKGTTTATLRDDWEFPPPPTSMPKADQQADQQESKKRDKQDDKQENKQESKQRNKQESKYYDQKDDRYHDKKDDKKDDDCDEPDPPPPQRKLRHLKAGDILIFEEIKGAKTGDVRDADWTHRHAVRLTRVEFCEDTLYPYKPDPCGEPSETEPANVKNSAGLSLPIVKIEWAKEDALPFALCLSAIGPAPDCRLVETISVARGNVLLVDHGRTIRDEDLGTVATKAVVLRCVAENQLAEAIVQSERFQPALQLAPLTFRQPLTDITLRTAAATSLLRQFTQQALPQITLTGTPAGIEGDRWLPRSDLLGSQGQNQHFVVEMDEDGQAHLRFGDNDLGQQPAAGTQFNATYRIGNGPAGNIGADTLAYVVLPQRLSGTQITPHNPFAATGGTPAEPIAEVKLFAPHAFRQELQRAITAEDYATIVRRDFKTQVQRAAAALRWTGSWPEILVVVDPLGAEVADPQLLQTIATHLERYRRIGHDLVVQSAVYVFLDIAMTVCVQSGYLQGQVKAALLDVFGDRRLADGRLGFFHPDNLTFGTPIALSQLVAAAQSVPGVQSATVTRLQRMGEAAVGELAQGVLALHPLEVARLDQDPSFPERGQFVLEMRGGR